MLKDSYIIFRPHSAILFNNSVTVNRYFTVVYPLIDLCFFTFLGYWSLRTDNLLPWSFVCRLSSVVRLSYFVCSISQNPSDNFFSNFAQLSGMSRRRHSSIFILLESFVFEWRPFLCQKWPFWGVFVKLQKNCTITFFLFFHE